MISILNDQDQYALWLTRRPEKVKREYTLEQTDQ